MNSANPEIERLLVEIKTEGRSSPAGYAWAEFHRLLKKRRQPGSPDVPMPLILAASGASDASKHRRLADQLQWASENGCLNEALRYLSALRSEQWNWSPPEWWNRDNYP